MTASLCLIFAALIAPSALRASPPGAALNVNQEGVNITNAVMTGTTGLVTGTVGYYIVMSPPTNIMTGPTPPIWVMGCSLYTNAAGGEQVVYFMGSNLGQTGGQLDTNHHAVGYFWETDYKGTTEAYSQFYPRGGGAAIRFDGAVGRVGWMEVQQKGENIGWWNPKQLLPAMRLATDTNQSNSEMGRGHLYLAGTFNLFNGDMTLQDGAPLNFVNVSNTLRTLQIVAGEFDPQDGSSLDDPVISGGDARKTLRIKSLTGVDIQTNATVRGSLSVSNVLYAKTNVAMFDIVTENFELNSIYTNAARRAYASACFSLTRSISNYAQVSLFVDQDGNGSFEQTGMPVKAGMGLAVDDIAQLGAWLQPSSRFMFTNQSSGSAAASVVAGSSQWTQQ